MLTDSEQAFAAYEALRPRLPQARFAGAAQAVDSLDDLAAGHDAFLLDAYGVLNRGSVPVPGVAARVRGLRAQGKRVLVLTNAASYDKGQAVARLAGLGYDFSADDIIASRDAALRAVPGFGLRHWGVMATALPEGIPGALLADDPAEYARAEGFLLLSSNTWTDDRQARLETAMIARPRPVLVGNPDLVAPQDAGFSREPGHFAHRLAGVTPVFHGKPFGSVYDLALARLPGVPRDRIVMVGDTLHTDVLGGAAAGLKTALVTGHGVLVGMDVADAIRRSGIVPDFVLHTP